MAKQGDFVFKNPDKVVVSDDFIPGWSVVLLGNKADLQDLCTLFCSPDLNVIEKKGNYYLRSSDFNLLADVKIVRLHAIELLRRMKGITRMCLGSFDSFDPIRVNTVIHGNEDGTVKNWGFGIGIPVNPRTRAVAGSGDSWIELAGRDEKADDALHHFAYDIPNWFDLYKVYEIIKKDVGGETKIVENGWASRSKIRLFSRSAQSERHASGKFTPPKKAMSILEAESLIGTLLEHWLRSK